MDILISGWTLGTLLYKNINGTFSSQTPSIPYGNIGNSVDMNDIDNDGDIDLIFCGSPNNSTPQTMLFTNEQGEFVFLNDSLIDVHSTASFGDFDNNGMVDVFEAGTNPFIPVKILLYKNMGNYNFDEHINENYFITGCSSTSWCDFDSDLDMDIAISSESWSNLPFVKIMINHNDSLTFSNTIEFLQTANGKIDFGE